MGAVARECVTAGAQANLVGLSRSGGGRFSNPRNNKALALLRGLCFVLFGAAPGVEKRNIFIFINRING